MTPIDLQEIKSFLKDTYKLGPEHIEVMLRSIKGSLVVEFDAAVKAVAQQDMTSLWKASHSIKGALLNAGAKDWAAYAQKIEMAAKEGEDVDYSVFLSELQDGLHALLSAN